MSLYTVIKFVHILLAIVAVGFNISYAIWLSLAARNPESAGLLLRGVKILDDRFANPAYALLLLSGIAMVFVAGYPLNTFWIDGAIVLWIIAMGWALSMYTPSLKRQIAALDKSGFGSPEYKTAQRRAQFIGLGNMVPILLIVVLMVFKPSAL